jgi:hypothetical protein
MKHDCKLITTRGGVLHYGLAIYIKRVLRQKKNYENSNLSPCKKYTLQKNPLKETKILPDIILTL